MDDLTINKILERLSTEYAVDATGWKKDVKVLVGEVMADAAKADESEEEEEEDEEEKPKKKGGFQKEYWLSDPLSIVCGGKAQASRTEVTKLVWEYIKNNNLQNPSDKRKIVADEVLQKVFKRKTTTMFKMNTLIGNNLYVI